MRNTTLTFLAVALVFLLAASSDAALRESAGYQIHKDVLDTGGGQFASENYKGFFALADPAAVGDAASTNYLNWGGFLGGVRDENPTAIELVSFTAEALDDAIIISWETATEADNAGFHLLRADTVNGDYQRITYNLIPAEGNEFTGASYEFTDGDVEEGTYYYKLEDISIYGMSTFHGPVEATIEAEPTFGCGMF